MSTTRAVTALAALIHDAQQRRSTAYGIALDVDRAQMLMSPETAAAAERVRESLSAAESANSDLEARLLSAETERDQLRARVAELVAAAEAIRHLHTDSPAGPCPVCVDNDAMIAGEDYTVPYPCPTARLAGAKDALPPSEAGRPLDHEFELLPVRQDPGAALKFARLVDVEDTLRVRSADRDRGITRHYWSCLLNVPYRPADSSCTCPDDYTDEDPDVVRDDEEGDEPACGPAGCVLPLAHAAGCIYTTGVPVCTCPDTGRVEAHDTGCPVGDAEDALGGAS